MRPNDAQCLRLLSSGGSIRLSQDELYRACVYLAYTGQTRSEESDLEGFYRDFLDVRRLIASGSLSEAIGRLGLISLDGAPGYLAGDREFIHGVIAQQLGQYRAAQDHMSRAAAIFNREGENHRYLRAAVNAEIYRLDFGSFVSGNLFGLAQACKQEGFHDLRANIQKACAVELLNLGRWEEANAASLDAIDSYEKEGSPADLAVAHCLAAIAQLMSGNIGQSKRSIGHVLLTSGKVEGYLAAYRALSEGKLPELPTSHPLSGSPWRVPLRKPNSITGKIVIRLENGPASRDELISEIWGPQAIHPSYRDRLYAAIKEIRRKGLAQVAFDGEFYRRAG